MNGWDAAEWQDIAALRKAAHGLAKHFEPGPQFVSWGDFTMGADGLTTEVAKGRGENVTTETVWIASAFEVIGVAAILTGAVGENGFAGETGTAGFTLAMSRMRRCRAILPRCAAALPMKA